MILYIATTNPGKLRDFAAAAQSAAEHITIEPLPHLKQIPAPQEDEPTFEANARLKARAYSRHAPGQIVIADDSGREGEALHGAPRVRSARYADDHAYTHPTSPAVLVLRLVHAYGVAASPRSTLHGTYAEALAISRADARI